MNASVVNFLVVLIAAILAPHQVSYQTQQPTSKVEIVAHRGASFDAPENTVAAAQLAWQQNADAVETDIRLTKDGQIIVSHDSTTKRINSRDTPISELTLAEARALDAGRRKGPQFAGEKMPTLDELIATIPAGKRLFVEIKTGPEILPALADALVRMHATEQSIVLISFDLEVLRQAHQKWPSYATLWLVGYDAASSPSIDQLIDQALQAGLNGLSLNSNWPLDAAAVNRIKAAQLQLHVWTVNDPKIAQRWVDMGVDGITTDCAGWMREQLET